MSEQDSVNPDDKDQAQPLIAHLIELRDRMLRAVIAVMVIFLSLYYFANDLYFLLSEPLRALLPEGATMIATGVASPFLTPFKLTFVASIFIAMPVILYQVWAFISPALFDKERKLAIPLLVSSIILFYFGMAFAYFVVFPLVFGFFTSAGPEDVAIMTDISQYLDFVLKMFFAFGFAFEIPIAIIILVAVG
ncbi:twin-arginine protein translocation system subunit TatC, partial [Oleiphilus sp. HI0122]